MTQMKNITILFLLLLSISSSVLSQSIKPIDESSKPELFGFSSNHLDTLSNFLERAGSSSLIILSKGRIVYEWGDTQKKHTIHSIRKPLISALFGIYVERGVIDTTETLRSLQIDDIEPRLSENEKSARIIDLLKSRSGVYHNAAANSKGMAANRPNRDTYKPDEHYFYNNWDFNILGAILENKTGKTVFELFYEEVGQRIGMTEFEGQYGKIDGEDDKSVIPDKDGFYQYEKSKSKYPAYHFRLSANDMARFGQLYINQGQWEGAQIISPEWIDMSTKAYSITNKGYGIGYGLLWFVLLKNHLRDSRSFYHTGNQVHFLAIYPKAEMVLVHRVDTENEYSFSQNDFYKMIDLVWASKIEK